MAALLSAGEYGGSSAVFQGINLTKVRLLLSLALHTLHSIHIPLQPNLSSFFPFIPWPNSHPKGRQPALQGALVVPGRAAIFSRLGCLHPRARHPWSQLQS